MDPVYDSAYFEDLAGRLYGLVISFSDRLPADQAQWLHHVVDVGEYGLALEDLAAMLTDDKITVNVATTVSFGIWPQFREGMRACVG